jgi:hypothetical protein
MEQQHRPTVQRTERGWAGHFCGANRCRFRRNTLLECGGTRIVVSTVGLLENIEGDGFTPIGFDRHFETMAFHAVFDGRYWDADVSKEISLQSSWSIAEVDADDRANDQHEAVVSEISAMLIDEHTP